MSNKDITIIINTFNSDEKIFSCLNSIDKNFNVFVIENSNNSQFKKRIEKEYNNVKCELTNDNLGYAKGNNLGLSKVTTKFALVLNPDTLLQKNALNNFLITANMYPDFAIIGPAIQEKGDEVKFKEDKNLIEVNNVKGFAMFLNIKEFKEIGFFDENFFIYFEEIDLCERVKNMNKKIYLDPSIIINHAGGSSHNKSINYEMELSRNWHWMWSSFYYHKKYNGFLIALMKVSRKLISSSIKYIIYSIINQNNKKKIYYQRMSGLFNAMIGKKSWYRPKIF